MNMYLKRKLRLLALLLLLSAGQLLHGGNLKFVVVIYDVVTYAPVAGKSVGFELTNLSLNQQVVQHTYTTGPSGDFVTPHFSLPGSTWYGYTFQVADCQSQPVVVTDSLFLSGNDTLFLYIGVCHSIMPGKCVASFYSVPDTNNPFIINFHNISAGHPTLYQWNFGDGTTSQMQHPVRHYTAPGSYLVCLTVSDTASAYPCQNTSCQVVNITQAVIIQAGFVAEIDSFALAPRRVIFENNSYSNVYLNHTMWNFGDGNTSQSLSPIHHYSQSGSYQVCLVTGYAGGITDTACSVVIIPEYYTIWGQLFANGTTIGKGSVQLIHPAMGIDGYRVVHEAPIDTLGLFFFVQRIEDHYLLRAFPDPGLSSADHLIPTYSGNTIYWKEATEISLSSNISNYDITLQRAIPPSGQGNGSVTGSVWTPAYQTVTDALVLLLYGDTRKPAAFTFTDTAGRYFLDNLPYGNYVLLAEVPGRETTELLITLSPQHTQLTGQEIYLDIIAGIIGMADNNRFSIHPNPAMDHVIITGTALSGSAIVKISDSHGKMVVLENVQGMSGYGEHRLDLTALPRGFYIITITN
jgi:PKD repeat protein